MLSPRDRLYFLHIPKTAGTTLKPLLDARFDEAEICPAELWRDLIRLPWDDVPKYRFFRGHFGGAGLATLLPEPPVTITFLRRTIPFVLSTYRFIRREPNTRFHALAASMSFADFVADPRPRRNLSNVQVRNLSFTLAQDPRPELAKVEQKTPWDVATRLEQLAAWLPPEEKLERATGRLRAMPCFGLTDRFDESMALLAYTFGWPHAGPVQKLMVAPPGSARPEVPDEIVEQIRAFNTLDGRLLAEAEPLFEARVAAMLRELGALARPGERPPVRYADDPALVATLLDRHYERAQAARAAPRVERIRVDFARRLDGSGWQGRERTGFDDSLFRWTGPDTVSTLDLPLVAGTDHRIELRTLNALAPDILDSLRLEAGGRPVELAVEGRGVVRTWRGLIPKQAIDRTRPFTRLTLRVNRTLSKASLDPNDPDTRQVGICVHWIALEATGTPAPAEPPVEVDEDAAEEAPAAEPAGRAPVPDMFERVRRWRTLAWTERVDRSVAHLRRCVVPWDELLRHPLSPEDRSPRAILFSHVKKSGGTTLQQVIARNYNANQLIHINAPDLYAHPEAAFKMRPGPDDALSRSFVLMGHHKYGDVVYSLLAPPVVHFTLLRDPVQRVLSHYRAVLAKSTHPLNRDVRGLRLADFLEANPALECRDAQTHRLAGTLQRRRLAAGVDGAEALETAKRNLLETVSLFGVTEEFDGFLLMAQRLLGWTDLSYVRQNVTPRAEPVEIREEDLELVRRINPLDLELHAFARRVFRERAAAVGITAEALAAHARAQVAFAGLVAPARPGAPPPTRAAPAVAAEPAVRAARPARPDAPLFITGRFRSGSTLLWQIFDRNQRHVAFYEPCHDNLPQQIGYGLPSPSHRGVERYWGAYLPILETVRALHRPEFGFDRLLLEAGESHAPLRDYLAALIAAAGGRRPVLQFNRCDFRLPWLRAEFPDAVLVHVVRSARDSWASTVRHLPPGQVDDPDHLDMYDLMQWSVALGETFPFLLDARSSYERHYLLWRLSALMGARHADVSIDFDAELQAEPERGIEALARVARLEREERTAARALVQRVPAGTWSAFHPPEYFAAIEERCERTLAALGLTERFGLEPLAAIRAAHAPPWAALEALPRDRTRAALAACSTLRGECTRLLHALRNSSEAHAPAGTEERAL